MNAMKENAAVSRLIKDASSIEEAVAAISGGEPLNAREYALIQAVTEMSKRANKSDNPIAFNHSEKELSAALGITKEKFDAFNTKAVSVFKRYMEEDEYTKQSQLLELIVQEFHNEGERLIGTFIISQMQISMFKKMAEMKERMLKAEMFDQLKGRGKSSPSDLDDLIQGMMGGGDDDDDDE